MKKTYTKLTVLSALPMALLSCLLLFGTTTATAQSGGLANDECATAILLTPGATCTTITGDNLGASASAQAVACFGTFNDDVWFQFDAVDANAVVNVTGSVGFDAIVQVLSGTCASTVEEACADNTADGGLESVSLTGLTIGDTYFVRVADYSGSALPTTTAFDICVVSVAPLAPCDMSAENGLWPSLPITPDAGGALTTITTAQFEGSEYSVLTGIVSGNFYQVEHVAGSYITVREGTVDGPVLTSGFALVAFTAASTSDLYVHWTLDEFCAVGGTAGSFLTTVQDLGLPPCENTDDFGSATASADAGTTVSISTNAYAGSEYSTISAVLNGFEYQLSHEAGSYATVRSGAVDGAVLAAGFSPLTFTGGSDATVYVHWTADAACTQDASGSWDTDILSIGYPLCENDVANLYPSSPVTVGGPTDGAVEIVNDQYLGGEYSVLTGLTASNEYVIAHDGGAFITVRIGAVDGPVLASGVSPLTIVALGADDLYVHWNEDITCAVDLNGVFVTTVENFGAACLAEAGTLITAESQVCFPGALVAVEGDAPVVPVGYVAVYVVTDGAGNVVGGPLTTPEYTPTAEGTFVMHTMVLDPNDQGTILAEAGNGAQAVADLFEENGGALCGSLDLNGVTFTSVICPDNDDCADAITIECGDALAGTTVNGSTSVDVTSAGIGVWYEFAGNGQDVTFSTCGAADFDTEITVLSGDCANLTNEGANDDFAGCAGATSELTVYAETGTTYYVYVSHFSNFSTTTGTFTLSATCNCTADAGTLAAVESEVCLVAGSTVEISATEATAPVAPVGYSVLYVLTSNPGLIIEAVNTTPEFTVTAGGEYTIHTLVYNPATLDLSVVVFGTTAAQDVLDIVGANEICAALDVTGAPITVNAPDAGTLTTDASPVCVGAAISATENVAPVVPAGYSVLYVLTEGAGLVIVDASATPSFTATAEGDFTVHTLVYNPLTLDPGGLPAGATGFDVNSALVQGGGSVCGALDVAGAEVTVDICTGINEALLSNLTVYPNPSNGQFVVEVNGVDADAQITVMDVAGRQIYTESVNMNGNFRKELNLNIASGTYLVQISTVEGKVTRKIQIN